MNYQDEFNPAYDPETREPDIFDLADDAREKDTINKQEEHDTDL